MTTAVQHRRGTTAEHAVFTGLEGEVTIDTTKDTAVIHDGSLAGGYPLAKESLANVNPGALSAITGSATAADDVFLVYDTSTTSMKKITRAELNNAIEADALASVTITGGTINGTSVGASTASSGAFTTLTTSGVTNLAGLTASTALALDASKNVVSVANTGTGSNVLNTSPTLVTPALGTPASGIMTNVTGTAAGLTAGNTTTNANLTGAVTSVGNAASLGSFTSAQLATALTDETGSGASVFATSPTLVTPALGTPSSGVVTNLTGTASININGTVGASTPSTGAFTTLSASGATILSGGTANGVAYLNGSKVLTSGSAMTFDGTRLTVKGGNAGQFVIDNGGEQYVQQLFQRNNAVNSGADFLFDGSASTFNIRTLAVAPIVFSVSASAGAPSEQMRLTSTGLGIGTSSPDQPLSVQTTSAALGINVVGRSSDNRAYIYFSENDATTFTGSIHTIPSSNRFNFNAYSGNNITFSVDGGEKMRLDSSGNLGLGVTPSAWDVGVAGGPVLQIGRALLFGANGETQLMLNAVYSTGDFRYIASGIASTRYKQNAGQHQWHTAPSGTAGNAISFTQAMTLDASGNLLVGTTSEVGARFSSSSGTRAWAGWFQQVNNAGNSVAMFEYSTGAPNNSTDYFGLLRDTSGQKVQLRSNGGIANFSANDVNLSDRREKTNFAPAKSYLDTICAIPVQTFNYIDQNMEEDPGLTLGVVAQDVQAVAPEMVMESNWGTKEEPKLRLSIYQTDLQYALMKCIQEQQALIASLTARLDAANL